MVGCAACNVTRYRYRSGTDFVKISPLSIYCKIICALLYNVVLKRRRIRTLDYFSLSKTSSNQYVSHNRVQTLAAFSNATEPRFIELSNQPTIHKNQYEIYMSHFKVLLTDQTPH